MPMSRDQATELAKRICKLGDGMKPPDGEVVVIVTDAAGEWVGVVATTRHGRTLQILNAAMNGADYKSHAVVIDMVPEACPELPPERTP